MTEEEPAVPAPRAARPRKAAGRNSHKATGPTSGAKAPEPAEAEAARDDATGEPADGEKAPANEPVPAEPSVPLPERLSALMEPAATLGGRDTMTSYRDSREGTIDLTQSHPSGLAQLLAGRATRLSSLIRDHDALADARRRARSIRAKAQQMAGERGLLTAHLAIGLATWNGVKGLTSLDLCAPVLLRRVALTPRGHRLEDFDVTLGDDVRVNPALVRFLADTHGLEIPADDWAALVRKSGGGFDPVPVLDALRRLTHRVPQFTVTQRLVISNFADLHGTFAREVLPADHAVLAALAGDPAARASVAAQQRAVAVAVPADGDAGPAGLQDRDPAGELLVLDIDGDQQGVVDAVLAGEQVAVDTPPGTGSTQLAVGLAATLAHAGKRVLYVAQGNDSLDDFSARAELAGLHDFVFDLRADSEARRRALIRMISADERAAAPDVESVVDVLRGFRRELKTHTEALHRERAPWGVSAHATMEHLARLTSAKPAPSTMVRLTPELLKSPEAKRRRLERDLGRLSELGAFTLDVEDTAWFGAFLGSDAEALEAHRVARRVAAESLPTLIREMEPLAEKADFTPGATVVEWGAQLEVLLEIRETLDQMSPDVFEQSLDDMIAATGSSAYRESKGSELSGGTRRRLKKLAREFVRPGAQIDDLHEALLKVRAQKAKWAALARHDGMPRVPRGLVEIQQTYASLAADLRRLDPVMATTPDGGDLEKMQIGELQARLEALADDETALTDLPERTELDGKLRVAGLGGLLDDLRARRVPHDLVPEEFELAWWASVLQAMASDDPAVGGHDGDQMRRVAADFRIADRRYVDMGSERVRWALASAWKAAIAAHPDQAGALREGLRGGTADVGSLLRRAPDVLGALAPVWVMSPLQVPESVPQGRFFDVVIVADAARLSLAEAAPAIGRGRQLVLLGDDRLMGPSGFTVSADRRFGPQNDVLSSADSVFAVAKSVLANRRLHTSYRVCPPGLVRFVNQHFYDSRIRTLPFAWTTDGSGLELAYVEDGTGAPDPTSEQVESVDAEVARVVRLVLDHARNRPRQSLAVVTVSPAHAVRVSAAVQAALVDYPYVASFFSDRVVEPFVVLDCEHVQGLTRDAVIFSIGYGRTAHNRILHRMGPLSQPGGQRLLASAITRARRRLSVVSCFAADDLDLTKLHHGAALLPLLIAEAARGGQTAGEARGSAPEADPLLADVAERLLRRGLYAQVNYQGQIDLSVANLQATDSGMVVAVETDGARYAATPSIRERERLREELLTRRGWRYVRVWSTDVFADPQTESDRIFDCWQEAVEELSPQALLGAARAAADVFRRTADRPPVAPGLPVAAYKSEDLDGMVEWIRSDGVERSDDELTEMLRSALAQKRRHQGADELLAAAVRRSRERQAAASAKAEDGPPAGGNGASDPAPGTTDDSGEENNMQHETGNGVASSAAAPQENGAPATEAVAEDKKPVLPTKAAEDEARAWGEGPDSNDERLLNERPPHW